MFRIAFATGPRRFFPTSPLQARKPREAPPPDVLQSERSLLARAGAWHATCACLVNSAERFERREAIRQLSIDDLSYP